MGYYTTINEITIAPNTYLLKDKVNTKCQDCIFFKNAELIYEPNYKLTGIETETYGKIYDEEEFLNYLSEILESGKIEISFTGEEGDQWIDVVEPGEYNTIGLESIRWDHYSEYEKYNTLLIKTDDVYQFEEDINLNILKIKKGDKINDLLNDLKALNLYLEKKYGQD